MQRNKYTNHATKINKPTITFFTKFLPDQQHKMQIQEYVIHRLSQLQSNPPLKANNETSKPK